MACGRVCIIHFENGFQSPKVHFQVTIDDTRKSDRYIRFGPWSGDKKGQGDEITGWIPKESYVIDEVLGDLQEDGTVIPIEIKAAA